LFQMLWRREKCLSPARNWTLAIHPIAHHYALWTFPAPHCVGNKNCIPDGSWQGTMFGHHWQNREPWYRTAVLVEQDHSNTSLQKWDGRCELWRHWSWGGWYEWWTQQGWWSQLKASHFKMETDSINLMYNMFYNIYFLSHICRKNVILINELTFSVQTRSLVQVHCRFILRLGLSSLLVNTVVHWKSG
jgi:hypothetical protein